jgi:hypothetical protein
MNRSLAASQHRSVSEQVSQLQTDLRTIAGSNL